MTVLDKKFSQFIDGGNLTVNDIVVGLRNGLNTRFVYNGEAGTYLPLSGGTMTGNINMGGHAITNMLNPVAAQDAATKAYVDAAIGGSVSPGLINELAWYAANGSTISGLPTANNGVLVTSAGGVPSISSTLPSGLTIPGYQTTITPAALTEFDDTNVTLTLGGSPATALLAAVSLTLGWTGQLGLNRGGTNASLTASNGGMVYSDATGLAILSGTATAGQIVLSGANSAPSWSTATYPATAGTAGFVLTSDGTNWISALPADSSIVIQDDTTTNATMYPTWVTASSGTLPLKVTSTKLFYNPSTSLLTNIGALGQITQIESSTGLEVLKFSYTASAVNEITATSAATGNAPSLSATGNDSNITLNLQGKGTGGAAVLGTSTNDNAAAGYVGEAISSVVAEASAVSLTTITAANITSISLAAGDWDVWGQVGWVIGGSSTVMAGAIHTTSATLPSSYLRSQRTYVAATFNGTNLAHVQQRRISVNTTTTVYLIGYGSFTTSTMTAFGEIVARRVR